VAAVEAEVDFLDVVYEAPLDPACWSDVLRRFTGLMGGHFASLVIQDQVTGAGRSIEIPEVQERRGLYFGYFAACNPLLRIQDFPARPRIMIDEEKVPKDIFVRTEFYNDFWRKYDFHSNLIARLAIENTNTTVINVLRSARREAFGGSDVEAASKLLPHLVRAVRLADRFSSLRELSCGTKEIIDRSRHAAFLVGADARLRYNNTAGESLLTAKCGMTLRNGMLIAATETLTRNLHGLIGAAAGRKGERTSATMALPRPDHIRPLSAIVSPLPSEQISVFCADPLVLVSVSDPDAKISVPEHRLHEVLGLTRAEARIALKLMEGHDPREAAQALGVSFYTVRAHLVRIFDKTGTRRQAELVALLMRLLDHLRD
jgi:DNA-binding CsgD family transcriptional regulator